MQFRWLFELHRYPRLCALARPTAIRLRIPLPAFLHLLFIEDLDPCPKNAQCMLERMANMAPAERHKLEQQLQKFWEARQKPQPEIEAPIQARFRNFISEVIAAGLYHGKTILLLAQVEESLYPKAQEPADPNQAFPYFVEPLALYGWLEKILRRRLGLEAGDEGQRPPCANA